MYNKLTVFVILHQNNKKIIIVKHNIYLVENSFCYFLMGINPN
jgi:hypothetical protein